MKKAKIILFISVIILITCLCCIDVFADEYNGFTYLPNIDDTITICGYSGSDTSVVIPSEIDGKPVTIINYYSFYNNENITSVSIPDSVTTIKEQAFVIVKI